MLSANTKDNLKQIQAKLSLFGWKIIYDWSFSLAALIAYYLLISLLPLIVSMFAVVSLIFSNDTEFQNRIRDRLIKAFPEQGFSDVLDPLLDAFSKQAGSVFIISFVVSIFTGSRLFVGLDDVLTIVYRIRERTIINQNILAIKMVLAFVIIMPFIIIFASIPAILQKHESFYQFLITFFSCMFAFIFFQLIYMILPKRQMSWRHTWCGALFAAIGLQLVLLFFPWYAHEFMADYVGQLGFVIVILLLFYLLGLLLVIGAQINAFFFDYIQPLTSGLGTCLCEFADREQIQLTDDNFRPNDVIVEELNTTKYQQQ
ncbi:unnamed protein product [Rotaria sordida]|uniref:Uncharacterized protein n=1 Tax=Rotaria sordida TaxID=392033 RepID=A0A819U331_9BILA|nr:unnamed protein product [Rotaria sordida]CAF4090864.1 unnamed protein product [Rotaria sordida]